MRERSDLFKGSAWNLVANGLTGVSALISVPFLARQYGWDRVGLILLGWGIIGFCSLLDLGVSRSLIRRLSNARTGGGSRGSYATALSLLAVAGTLGGGCVVYLASVWVSARPWSGDELARELREALPLLWPLIAISVVSTGARAPLEADRRFGISALTRSLPGVAGLAFPLLLPASVRTLTSVLLVWIVLYGAALILSFGASLQGSRALCSGGPKAKIARELMSEGAWLLVSMVLSPLLALGDRYAVSFAAPLTIIAAYAVAHDLAIRLLLIPKAVTAALLPVASAAGSGKPDESADSASRALRWILLPLGTLLLIVLPFGPEILGAWVGRERGMSVWPFLGLLCAGVMMNAAAHVPVVMLQAAGRARGVALIHAVESGVYAGVLILLARTGSVQAFAWAYAGLQAVDLLMMCYLLTRKGGFPGIWASAATSGGVSIVVAALSLVPLPRDLRLLLSFAALATLCVLMLTRVGRKDVEPVRRSLRGAEL